MSGKVSASKDGEGIIFHSGLWASVAAIPIMTLGVSMLTLLISLSWVGRSVGPLLSLRTEYKVPDQLFTNSDH